SIAVEPFVSKLSSYGGVLAWSHWDAAVQAFRLLARQGGRTSALPIASRSVPFDVDLGPDVRHAVTAVYSRCRQERPAWVEGVVFARFTPPAGCSLYRYDFSSGREHRIGHLVGAASG